jgi:RHS repeat-associated protein
VTRTISFVFDAAGQLTQASDPAAAYEYDYDVAGRLETESQTLTGLTPEIILARAYDTANRLTSLAATIGANLDFKNEYLYDDANRLERITQAGQGGGNTVAEKRVDFAYNAASQFDTITRYADLVGTELVATTTFGYEEGIGRLESIAHAKGLATLASYDYSYDLAGRIDAIDSLLDGLTTYSHDNRGQLTDADHASITDEAYEYDDNGNRTGGDYDTDPNNLTVEDENYTYAYDDEGNRILRTEKATGDYVEYGWDHRNRLTLVTFKNSSHTTTKTVAYEYDVFDRRVRKRVDGNGNGTWDRGEQYVYDGAHIVLVFDDSGDLIRRNLFGPAIDQILASEFIGTPNDTNWYFADHLGTVRDVYSFDDVLNDLVSEGHIEYDSFGNIVDGAAVAEETRFAYTGREWDADAELYYYRARWYDPVLGEFISSDPIGLGPDLNARRYVENQPTMLTDPSGLAPDDFNGWPGGGWNPMNWVHGVGYYGTKWGFDCYYGNYDKSLANKRAMSDLELRTNSTNNSVELDEIRKRLHEQNQKPIPPEWAELIEQAVMAVASSYGTVFEYVSPVSTGVLTGTTRYKTHRTPGRVFGLDEWVINPAKATQARREMAKLLAEYAKDTGKKIKIVPWKENSCGALAQFFPETGEIVIYEGGTHVLHEAALMEELLHYGQYKKAGLLGKTETEIGAATVRRFEEEVEALLEQSGFMRFRPR